MSGWQALLFSVGSWLMIVSAALGCYILSIALCFVAEWLVEKLKRERG